jgi:hypothetical protein
MKKIPPNYISDVFSRDHALLVISFFEESAVDGESCVADVL